MFRKSILGLLLLFSIGTSSAHAQALEVVFKDGLWGAGIGTTIALASWSLSDQSTDELRKQLTRGASLGLLAGVGYGLYEVNSGNSLFSQTPPAEPSLLSYQVSSHRLEVRPVFPTPALHASSSDAWSWNVFQAQF